MAFYLMRFSYTPETWSKLIQNPEDRRDAARAYIESAHAIAGGVRIEVEMIDMLESEERVALLLREIFHLRDGAVQIRRANVYRVSGEEIVEIWIFEGDQYEVDALFG
jgi:hypothetical protein